MENKYWKVLKIVLQNFKSGGEKCSYLQWQCQGALVEKVVGTEWSKGVAPNCKVSNCVLYRTVHEFNKMIILECPEAIHDKLLTMVHYNSSKVGILKTSGK
jgi:hypothetical protein